jgi:hemoglobin/transferrin/lactoferrin receptor protein
MSRVRVFASWSEAFRAPSLNELYLSDTHFSLPHPVLGFPTFITNEFIANPDLKPEETETFEIGAGFIQQGVFGTDDRFEIKGAWFQTDATDLINLDVDFAFSPTCFAPPFFQPCSAGTSFSENLDSAELDGFEIAAAYVNGPFELSGALYEVDGEILRRVSPSARCSRSWVTSMRATLRAPAPDGGRPSRLCR